MKRIQLTVFLALISCAGREKAATSDSTIADSVPSPVRVAVDSGAPRLEPRDEANASFRSFRERALDALSRRDTAFLYSIVSPDIRTSFGDGGGLRGFKDMWKPAESSSTVWATLSRVLRLGGQLKGDTSFVAPYVYAFWPDSIDAFSYVAVTRENAVVYSKSDTTAGVLGSATHSILRVGEWTALPGSSAVADTSWVRIELPTKQTGWLRATDVYSPVGWRAAFVRHGDQWLMIFFVSGD